MMEKMKTTAPVSSVGADGVQPNVKNHNEIIANSQEQINQQATKIVITHETNRDFKARFVCFQNVAYTYILYI